MVVSKDLVPSTVGFGTVFYYNQFKAKPHWPSPNKTLSGQIAIVTESNTGLSYEVALQLLGLKLSHLILAVRSLQKGDTAAAKLYKLYPEARIEVYELDVSSYESIPAFARRVESKLLHIDIIILNAGVMKLTFGMDKSTGHEETLPRRSQEIPPQETYNTSKLLSHMFLWKLVDYVSADDVIVNLSDPAWVKGTELARETKGAVKVGLSSSKPSEGALKSAPRALSTRFAAMLYTPEGKVIIERVWNETLAEFDFAGARAILDSMRA